MRKISVITCLLLLSMGVRAQQEIEFVRANNFAEVVSQAKAQNKIIFVNCFATWCMPCRYMSDSIFTKKEVADYFNENFINIKRSTVHLHPEHRRTHSNNNHKISISCLLRELK